MSQELVKLFLESVPTLTSILHTDDANTQVQILTDTSKMYG